jgi:hypothetical protein
LFGIRGRKAKDGGGGPTCGTYLVAVTTAAMRERIEPTYGTRPTGAVTRPLDGSALSLAGNAHAGEGSRSGTTTSSPAAMATLDLAWTRLKKWGRER